jgi:hypothetical protein
LCALYAGPPRQRKLDLQLRPVVLRLALNAGGAGGLRRDFEFTGGMVFKERNSNPGGSTTQEAQHDEVGHDILEQLETALAALNVLCTGVMPIWETNARMA